MSKFLEDVKDFVIEMVVLAISWLVCMAILAGFYAMGRWAAPHFGWDAGREMFGLLSALTVLWIYEHRNIEGKYDRLRELIARQEP